MVSLNAFREGLKPYFTDGFERPFVCNGSPLLARSFIVGLNAATRLSRPFQCYWSDETGFDYGKFQADYAATGKRKGNRRVIEAISAQIAPCLETNLFAVPTRRARELRREDREKSGLVEYLFGIIRPAVVFAHGSDSVKYFAEKTRATGFCEAPVWASWQETNFVLLGRSGPLYTVSTGDAKNIGDKLAKFLPSTDTCPIPG